jgi:hypothetical protein
MIPASLSNIRLIIEKSYPSFEGTELVEREGKKILPVKYMHLYQVLQA